MLEKEIKDYVKVQRSLEVSDAEIKKSLVSAGYTEEDFKGEFTKKSKKDPLKKDFNPTGKQILYLNITIIIVFGLIFTYLAYDYNTKLNNLSLEQEQQMSNIGEKMTSETVTLRTDIASLGDSLGDELDMTNTRLEDINKELQSSIQNYNYQSLSRDAALSNTMQKISNRSLTELSSFGEQLETFREASVDFSRIIPKAIDAVVTIGSKGAGYFTTAGSGVFINNKGYIVTNYHVIDDLGTVTVKTNDDTEYTATVIGKDADWDVAVIKLVTEKDDFEYLEWADSDKVDVGDRVIAIGNPVGFDSTVTEGIISNTKRLISNNIDIYYFQSDVAINAGNSGGPLIDKEGKIVGIATLKYSRIGFEGLSFALRSNDVQGIVLGILQEE